MESTGIVESIEASGLAEWLRGSLLAIPVIEAVHVMAVALVFGTILIVDLRLLGLPSTRRSFARISDELLRLTWAGFALALATGVLMFVANASTYLANIPFRFKMLALVGAGINMAVFQLMTARNVGAWDRDVVPPPSARAAGIVSLLLWTAIIFLGRWVGFTQGYDFSIPEDMEFNFDFE